MRLAKILALVVQFVAFYWERPSPAVDCNELVMIQIRFREHRDDKTHVNNSKTVRNSITADISVQQQYKILISHPIRENLFQFSSWPKIIAASLKFKDKVFFVSIVDTFM